MKKIISMLIITAVCCIGCKNDDDKPLDPNSGLYHFWTLINVSGGFAGTDYNFNEGTIVWQFKANGTVAVVNNNQDESKEDFYNTGTYAYKIKPNTSQIEGCSQSMDIDTQTFYCYTFNSQGQLVLDSSPVDGLRLIFNRTDLDE